MIKWVIGHNSSGKTLFLNKELMKYRSNKISVVTNVTKSIRYNLFNDERISLLSSEDAYERIFDYNKLQIHGNTLYVDAPYDYNYTSRFLELLTLLCRRGNVLILDEPELGLPWLELNLLYKIFELLIPTYDDVIIVTHHSEFFSLNEDCFWLCSDYGLEKIDEDTLYGYISKF